MACTDVCCAGGRPLTKSNGALRAFDTARPIPDRGQSPFSPAGMAKHRHRVELTRQPPLRQATRGTGSLQDRVPGAIEADTVSGDEARASGASTARDSMHAPFSGKSRVAKPTGLEGGVAPLSRPEGAGVMKRAGESLPCGAGSHPCPRASSDRGRVDRAPSARKASAFKKPRLPVTAPLLPAGAADAAGETWTRRRRSSAPPIMITAGRSQSSLSRRVLPSARTRATLLLPPPQFSFAAEEAVYARTSGRGLCTVVTIAILVPRRSTPLVPGPDSGTSGPCQLSSKYLLSSAAALLKKK